MPQAGHPLHLGHLSGLGLFTQLGAAPSLHWEHWCHVRIVIEHISHFSKQGLAKANLNCTKDDIIPLEKLHHRALERSLLLLFSKQHFTFPVQTRDQSVSDPLNLVFLPGRTDSIHTGAWPRSVKPKLLLPL